MREQIAHYRVLRFIGQGGMGVVYAARDERLGRTVAIKTLPDSARDETARQRLWQEARAAASLSHPGICHVYEVGESDGEVYIAMELLVGETLSQRVESGPLSVADAVGITLGVLDTLEALHARGMTHRDLKPSNVFLTEHGIKLLDFGLARPAPLDADADTRLTVPGTAMGTPRSMAPEQWTGGDVGPPADVFAVGAMLFEMLAGRPAFPGAAPVEVYHAIMYEDPPALAGGVESMGIDRVIQRSLSKRPEDRFQTAGAMAQALREASRVMAPAPGVHVRALTRVIVLPFRTVRPDPVVDFLSVGLAEAISATLSGFDSLLVRSSAAAAKFGPGQPDPKALAREAGVDMAVFGTLMRAGDQVRVTMQLVETPSGSVRCSRTAQGTVDDLFVLQDTLAGDLVRALAPSLTAGVSDAARASVPATPAA